jgi:multidrug efflux pump subunit AcrA (membrane-fusion protein)
MPVHLTWDSIPDLKLEGKIKFISPSAISKTDEKSIHIFPTIVSFETKDPRVKVGLTANLVIPLSHMDQALSLPISMVFEDEKGSFVYIKKNDVLSRKDIEVGISDAEYIEIKSGLQEGEEVFLTSTPEKQQ